MHAPGILLTGSFWQIVFGSERSSRESRLNSQSSSMLLSPFVLAFPFKTSCLEKKYNNIYNIRLFRYDYIRQCIWYQ